MLFNNPNPSHSNDESSFVPMISANANESIAYLNGKIDAQANIISMLNTYFVTELSKERRKETDFLQNEKSKAVKELLTIEELKQMLMKKETDLEKENIYLSIEVKALQNDKNKLISELSVLTKDISELNEPFEKERKEKEKLINELTTSISETAEDRNCLAV